jgi:lipoprotein-anchoring transpeptidase ErfK/SrfK
VALACLVALVAAGCSRGPSEPATAAPPQTIPAPAVTEAPPSTNGPVSLGSAAAYAALARDENVTVLSRPGGGKEIELFPAKLPWGTPTRRVDGELWYRVLLPKRPNESSGWVSAAQVRATPRAYRAEVDLSARRLTLFKDGDAVGSFPVAIGEPGTPTPTGRFFVTVKLHPPQISTVYGAWALGLSAYSEVLDQFGTGDGQIALHGTADPGQLGRAVSHGCVRLDNTSITTLAGLLAPGSPVDIHA